MLFLRLLLLIVSFSFLAGAICTVAYDIYLAFELGRVLRRNDRRDDRPAEFAAAPLAPGASEPAAATPPRLPQAPPRTTPRRPIRWTFAAKLLAIAALTSLAAKSDSDSMQYTLPLKQKQIEQSRLEAQARKEATIQNAEAEATASVKTAEAAGQSRIIESKAEAERNRVLAEQQYILVVKNAEASAQAKLVSSKAEAEQRNLLADAEAHNIRVTSQAESEQLQLQAAALKTNPLLVQYTVAQRLSDRVQIMMVPTDGKFFFTNDVLKSVGAVTDNPTKLGAK